MAVAFTVNSTASAGEWTVIDAYSTDVSTAQALLAAKTGHHYLVKAFSIDVQSSEDWIKIFNGAVLQLGPCEPRSNIWKERFESAMVFSGAINIQTKTDELIHVTMQYRVYPD